MLNRQSGNRESVAAANTSLWLPKKHMKENVVADKNTRSRDVEYHAKVEDIITAQTTNPCQPLPLHHHRIRLAVLEQHWQLWLPTPVHRIDSSAHGRLLRPQP
jgi:putative SOS response-associated peptidase YedK